ncbi:MAG: ABC transporter permease [Thermotogota bacterium]|nr:ABC transporter permease [Thermotogota bacterium]
MHSFFSLFKGLFKNEIRDFQAIAWCMIFPVFLFFVLTSIFSNIAGVESSGLPVLELGVVKEEKLSGFGTIIDQILDDISGDNGPYKQQTYENKVEGIEALKNKQIDILFVIPEGTNIKMARALMTRDISEDKITSEIYHAAGKQISILASNIMSQIMQQVNLEISKRSSDSYIDFELNEEIISSSSSEESFDYVTYLFPGVIIMLILAVSLFNGPLSMIETKESGITKKLYTTSITPITYLGAQILKLFSLIFISLVIFYTFVLLFYDLGSVIFNVGFLFSIFYSSIVLLGFGLMIASFTKKGSTAMVFSQIANQKLMFLGGLYFPVFDIPWSLRWLVYALPTTYLVELLRTSIGYGVSSINTAFLFLIPGIWLTASIVLFTANFKKVMGYE